MPNTQIYKDAIRETVLLLKGKHKKLPRYTRQKIKTAIDNFAQAVTDPEFWPHKKDLLKKIALTEFYFNPYHKDKRSRSYLEHYLYNPPEPINKAPKELNPKLTQALYSVYNKERLGGASVKFTRADRINFVLGANKLHKILDENKDKVVMLMMRNEMEIADVFWQSVSEKRDKSRITPAWFSSDLSMRRFIEYATDNGYLRSNWV